MLILRRIYEAIAESNIRHNEFFNKTSIDDEIQSKLNAYIITINEKVIREGIKSARAKDPTNTKKNITKNDIETYKTSLISQQRTVIRDQVRVNREKQWYMKYGAQAETHLNIAPVIENTFDFFNYDEL